MASSIPFAIFGFGRIGRAVARIAHRRPELALAAVADVASAADLARLLARDSVHGRFDAEISTSDDAFSIDGRLVPFFRVDEPAKVPWPSGVRVVLDASGTSTRRERAAGHLARLGEEARVLISAISPDADAMICPGLNDEILDLSRDSTQRVISAASCTTHCLALVLDVLVRAFGLRRALVSEVHGYTANQRLVDAPHPDPRRSRAAAVNIVPTSSAAPAAIERIVPALRGKLAGMAVRVPTPSMALLDVVAELERPATLDAVRDAYRVAAEDRHRGRLAVTDEPLVSSDLVGDPHSAIVDLGLVQSVAAPDTPRSTSGPLVRVQAWYDNEWGYAHRLTDLSITLGETR